MIIILTDGDLEGNVSPRSMFDLPEAAFRDACLAEDVYFWRDGEVRPLKRRNAPLVVPDWIKNLEGVDQEFRVT